MGELLWEKLGGRFCTEEILGERFSTGDLIWEISGGRFQVGEFRWEI